MSDEKDSNYDELKKYLLCNDSVEAYLRIRQKYPNSDFDEELRRRMSFGADALFVLESEAKTFGISGYDIALVMDCDIQAIDRLSVQLIDLLLDRDRKVKSGETTVQSRKICISDALVDYLVTLIIEGLAKGLNPPPMSVFILIRKRLGVFNTRFDQKEDAGRRFVEIVAAAYLNRDENGLPSYRRVAEITGVNVSTISRLFPENSLADEVERMKPMLRSLEERISSERN